MVLGGRSGGGEGKDLHGKRWLTPKEPKVLLKKLIFRRRERRYPSGTTKRPTLLRGEKRAATTGQTEKRGGGETGQNYLENKDKKNQL